MILKHKNRELLRFEWTEDNVSVVSADETAKHLFPPELAESVSDESLWKWIRGRAIPANRHYVQSFLARLGLNERDMRGIISICRGLSLNDVYWVADDNSTDRFEDVNLYDNKFTPALSAMAFTGIGAFSTPNLVSSPEFTTNGVLAKCWRRIGGEVFLFKSGTEGAANAGFEPYSEFYAAQVAEAMGLAHVEYGLAKFKGRLCSTCRLFTSNATGFAAASRVLTSGQISSLIQPGGTADEDADLPPCGEDFTDMFLFDAVICNEDRHLGNFGYLVDNETNRISGAAPLFDHGNSLFSRALFSEKYEDDFSDLQKYAATRRPALYGDWFAPLRGRMTPRRRKMLERVATMEFRRHNAHNLPARRLSAIERFVRDRAERILTMDDRSLARGSRTKSFKQATNH